MVSPSLTVSPQECLGKVCHCMISHTPFLLLQRGLLGEGEADQLAVHVWLTHQQGEQFPRWSSNLSENRYQWLTRLDLLLLHLVVCQFVQPPHRLLGELQILVKSGVIHLKGVSHEIFRVLFWLLWISLGLYKNLWLFLFFFVEPLILYLPLKFRHG
jgi:hypothetical protein